MKQKTREVLELFVEKAWWLNNCQFIRFLYERGLEVTVGADYTTNQVVEKILSPDKESRDALLMTFRLFIQDKEVVSLHNIDKILLNEQDLSNNWKTHFNILKARLNQMLNESPALIRIDDNGQSLSNKDFMNIFLYGEIAHNDPKKREQFLRWKETPLFFPMAEFFFYNVLAAYMEGVFRIAYLTQLELKGKPIVPYLPGLLMASCLSKGQKSAGWKILLRGKPKMPVSYKGIPIVYLKTLPYIKAQT